MRIFVQKKAGQKITLEVEISDTIENTKYKLMKKLKIPIDSINLFY